MSLSPLLAFHSHLQLQGNNSGQLAVGNYIYQIQGVQGDVINLAPPEWAAEFS
jgi:hypothetical protein